MLTKYEADHAIHSYHDLKQGLWWCTQAKNDYSIPEGVFTGNLVLGKQTRLPGSNCSDELLPAHMLADSESAKACSLDCSWPAVKVPERPLSKLTMMLHCEELYSVSQKGNPENTLRENG